MDISPWTHRELNPNLMLFCLSISLRRLTVKEPWFLTLQSTHPAVELWARTLGNWKHYFLSTEWNVFRHLVYFNDFSDSFWKIFLYNFKNKFKIFRRWSHKNQKIFGALKITKWFFWHPQDGSHNIIHLALIIPTYFNLKYLGGDPSAGSPTDTLWQLNLPYYI